jgi:hypothetical protein
LEEVLGLLVNRRALLIFRAGLHHGNEIAKLRVGPVLDQFGSRDEVQGAFPVVVRISATSF